MLKLYEYASSGNCYKIRLLLNQLGITYQRIPTDILKGESRTPGFLAMNPVGKTPVLEINLCLYPCCD
jgi:glutathione S-transferase